ncbi:MAG: sigma-70 family RNA polymerase sigma factor [Cyclobacteriaceae bacterium]|nr:sigma-70 family RNA polymerase sigma factor [Cyclobacteriaceae bacterium]
MQKNYDESNKNAESESIPGVAHVKSNSSDVITSDDEILIRKAFNDQPEKGMELLYLRYYQPLCSHAVKYVVSRQLAEDMVSDLFFKFYEQKKYENIQSSFRLYLFRAVRNTGFNYLKWDVARNHKLEDFPEPVIAETYQPDSITQYEDLCKDLEKAVSALPVQQRRIYLSFQFEGKSMKDIAFDLGLSARTVEVQIYRARNTVRALLRDKWLTLWGVLLFFQ